MRDLLFTKRHIGPKMEKTRDLRESAPLAPAGRGVGGGVGGEGAGHAAAIPEPSPKSLARCGKTSAFLHTGNPPLPMKSSQGFIPSPRWGEGNRHC